MTLLAVEGVVVEHAGSPVLRGVSLEVESDEVVAVVGANGAGKTTLLRTIVGLEHSRAGSVRFKGQELMGLPPQAIVRAGIRCVTQQRNLFPHSSVLDNLRLGAFLVRDTKEAERRLERVFAQFPILAERKQQRARTLSGGEQQMLAIGRALMGRPELLILDEPSLALAPAMVKAIANIIAELAQQGVSILLVEQNLELALDVAQRAYALAGGRVVLEGPAQTLRADPSLEHVYLGGDLGARQSVRPLPLASLRTPAAE